MIYKSELVKFPKCVKQCGLVSTMSFSILTRDRLYIRSLYPDKIDKELNLFCVIDYCKNSLILCGYVNKRSGLALFTQI